MPLSVARVGGFPNTRSSIKICDEIGLQELYYFLKSVFLIGMMSKNWMKCSSATHFSQYKQPNIVMKNIVH